MRTLKALVAIGCISLPATAATACPDHGDRFFAFAGLMHGAGSGGSSADQPQDGRSDDGGQSSSSSPSSNTADDLGSRSFETQGSGENSNPTGSDRNVVETSGAQEQNSAPSDYNPNEGATFR